MKKVILLMIVVLGCINIGSAKEGDYLKLWKEADGFFNKGFPKSGFEVVQKIYNQAKVEKNTGQIAKALIYKLKSIQLVEEDSFIKIQTELTEAINESEPSFKALFHSMLAEQYWNYFLNNRWRFYQRSETAQFEDSDLRTWDLKKIVKTVTEHYEKSLESAEVLKNTKIEEILPVLYHESPNMRDRRPSLFDFLAHRAVDFFTNGEAGLTEPAYQFLMDDERLLESVKSFAELNIEIKDTDSFKYKALQTFQKIIEFHLHDEVKDALIDADIKRLKWVYQNSVIHNKDKLYIQALNGLIEKHSENFVVSEALYEIALYHKDVGGRYQPLAADSHKWELKQAIEICEKTISNYPGSIGASLCKDLIKLIQTKNIELKFEKTNPVNQPFLGLIKYKNVSKAYFRVIKTKPEFFFQRYHEERLEYFITQAVSKVFEYELPDDYDYQSHSLEFSLPALESGFYVILASSGKEFDTQKDSIALSSLSVSNISYICRNNYEKGLEVYLFDREKGIPLPQVKAQLWYQEYNNSTHKYYYKKGEVYSSDNFGYIVVNKKNDNYFWLEFTKGDDFLWNESQFNSYTYHQNEKSVQTVFFLDRAIYRPGQQVHYKGIMLERDSKNPEKARLLDNYQTSVYFKDVNYQLIKEEIIKTNEFGSFSGTFEIPVSLLNGQMSISTNYGNVYFSVEEYKRPKFFVKFDEAKESYKLNDEVTVRGSALAFAGYPIDNAEVKFRVVRKAYYPFHWLFWWYTPPQNQMEITFGNLKTSNKGEFEIKFKALPDVSLDRSYKPAYHFVVYADITDLNGETRSGTKSITVGETDVLVSVNLPDTIEKELKSDFFISSTNLNGEFIPAKGKIEIYELKPPDKPLKSKLWETPDRHIIPKKEFEKIFPHHVYAREDHVETWEKLKSIHQTSFDTEKEKQLCIPFKNFETGKFVLEMKIDNSEEVIFKKYFTIYSKTDETPPYPTTDYFAPLITTVHPGQTAEVLIGSSDNISVLYETEHRGEIIQKKFVPLNAEQKLIKIPVDENNRGNLSVNFTFVKWGRVYQHPVNIVVPWDNKNLKISFESFRHKLLPGEQEEWKIKITGTDNDRLAAEMVACLYDASLDTFRPNYWYFNVFNSFYFRNYWDGNNFSSMSYSEHYGCRYNRRSISKVYDILNWFDFYWSENHWGRRKCLKSGGDIMEDCISEIAENCAPQACVPLEKQKGEGLGFCDANVSCKENKKEERKFRLSGESGPGDEDGGEMDKEEVKVRTNFNETAFFYPHLLTNETGEITVSFTVPEALTKWKMMGFAHTKNIEYGSISNELVTQKDLMINPNTPRFFRSGDKMVFCAKVSNLSEEKLIGEAILSFLDPVTGKSIDHLFKNEDSKKQFSVQKGESTVVAFNIEVPVDLELATVRMIAKSETLSDGEETIVPVLKNSMLVTDTMPLPVNPNETKNFKFEELLNLKNSDTLKPYKLTFEFTPNPAWYAVLALPYMMEYPHECNEQTFSRYFANTISRHIVNSSPEIKRIFLAWKNTPESTSLTGNLEKNQELKSLLLEETPWVREGRDETERRHRIGILFDDNRLNNEMERALSKLQKEQRANGAFSWFSKGPENRYITQHIVSGFAHLLALNVLPEKDKKVILQMMKKAIAFLDYRIKEDYEYLIRRKIDLSQINLGYEQIHYLYARSYFIELPLPNDCAPAFDYFKRQAVKYWFDFNRYAQGMIGIFLFRYDDRNTPSFILKSLIERALFAEEIGMYWKDNYGFYFWEAPIETQALMIEFFSILKPDDTETLNRLKTWLLKSKQTQDFGTTKATAEACYALLLQGGNWLLENKEPDISLGDIKIDLSKMRKEAGTMYIKTSFDKEEIKSEMGNITVKNNNNCAAWGGVYFQYFEDLDKIKCSKTPLSLEKKLFVEKMSDTGPRIFPIEKEELKIGDKITVRIVIRVDRDMEFVHLKDMRASAFEPVEVISSYKWQDGLGYYESTKDASTNFFIDYLHKGTYVFEYPLRVTHEGDFSNGITTIQCMYAPEFSSHSEGIRVEVKGNN